MKLTLLYPRHSSISSVKTLYNQVKISSNKGLNIDGLLIWQIK